MEIHAFILVNKNKIPFSIVDESKNNKFDHVIYECIDNRYYPTLYGSNDEAQNELNNLAKYPDHYTWLLVEQPLFVRECLLTW